MKLFSKKKDFSDLYSIKEINKKVKELTPLKEGESDHELNLTIILKSIINTLYNFSRQLNLGNDSKQELDIPSIEKYLNQFKIKSYYNIKIVPVIEFLKSYYLITKVENAFLYSIKDINTNANKEKKLSDNHIDRLNYIIINKFELLMNSKNSLELFAKLYYLIQQFERKKYNYLFDYYIVILLISLFFVELEDNNNDKKIITNILTILFIIISEDQNEYIVELAFLLFCEFYSKVDNNPFTFTEQNKWLFLLLKLFKNEIHIFPSDSKAKNLYDFIKPFHYKYFLWEIQRNKLRDSYLKETLLIAVTKNIIESIKYPSNNEEAQIYLNDKIYEKFPKEFHLPQGPSNSLYKFLFKLNKDFNQKINKKRSSIYLGALQISSIIRQNKYQEKDFDFNYFSKKLANEIVNLVMPLFIKDKHIMRISLYSLGSMMKICPETIIKYFPNIFKIFKGMGNKDKQFLNLSSELNYFFQRCSEIIQKAYNENNTKIIAQINQINKSIEFFQDIYSSMIIIFHLQNLKIVKSSENPEVNFSSLLNNAFNFFSIIINEYFLEYHYLPFDVEVDLIYLISKFPTLYLKKYMKKIICKIYTEHVLIGIYTNLFIDDFNGLRYKSLFFVIRLLLVEKKYNYLNFFVCFIKKNIIFEITSPSEILEYLDSHFSINKDKICLINSEKEEEKYQINSDEKELEIYNLSNPNKNKRLLNYIIDILFKCIKTSSNLNDIVNINKLLKIIFLNLIQIEEKNVVILLEFLMKYLNNINKSVSEKGYQNNQNNLKKLFEVLYYTHFYININEFKDILIKKINSQFLVRFYHFVMIGIFELFPINIISQEHNFLNIIPVIYLYLFMFNNLMETDNNQNEELKTIISEITKFIIDIAKNNYNNSQIKNKHIFNSFHLAIFNIFSLITIIDSKRYFSFIPYYLDKFLNIEEIKFDINNADVNALNFTLINLFSRFLYQFESNKNHSNKLDEVLSKIKTKTPNIYHIYNTIKEFNKKINNIDEQKDEQNIKVINEYEQKNNFIIENLKFNSKTNFIQFSFEKNEIEDNKGNKIIIKDKSNNKKEIILEKDLNGKNESIYNNYISWLKFLNQLITILKSKKKNLDQEIKKYDGLLKSSFSFNCKKRENYICLIKSEEIVDKDISLFNIFLTNLGDIITNDNSFIIRRESDYDKFIIDINNKNSLILFILIKDNFHQYEDSILNEKFIIYIKPMNLKSVYSIKIWKNSDIKNKNNDKIKICKQIDNDLNQMFSDFIIIDFNNKAQVDFFYKIVDLLFEYSQLENLIKNSIMNLSNK